MNPRFFLPTRNAARVRYAYSPRTSPAKWQGLTSSPAITLLPERNNLHDDTWPSAALLKSVNGFERVGHRIVNAEQLADAFARCSRPRIYQSDLANFHLLSPSTGGKYACTAANQAGEQVNSLQYLLLNPSRKSCST
jgi:hypothetical protein